MAVISRSLIGASGAVDVTCDEGATLLSVARQFLGFRSAAAACGDGRCGTCRLLVDGVLVNACGRTMASVRDGARIEGEESLSDDEAAQDAVAAFVDDRPTRCRLCVPALAVTAAALARRGERGVETAVEAALATATCMCTGRGSLRRALLAPQKQDARSSEEAERPGRRQP